MSIRLAQEILNELMTAHVMAEKLGWVCADELADAVRAMESQIDYMLEGPRLVSPRYIDRSPMDAANATLQRIIMGEAA